MPSLNFVMNSSLSFFGSKISHLGYESSSAWIFGKAEETYRSMASIFSDSKSFCGNDVLSTTGDSEGYHASLKGNSVVHWNKRFTIGRNKADVH